MFHVQDRITDRRLPPKGILVHMSAHHHPHQRMGRNLVNVAGGNLLAVAQDGDPVGNLEHFGQMMGDVHNGQPPVTKAANDFKQALHFLP